MKKKNCQIVTYRVLNGSLDRKSGTDPVKLLFDKSLTELVMM